MPPTTAIPATLSPPRRQEAVKTDGLNADVIRARPWRRQEQVVGPSADRLDTARAASRYKARPGALGLRAGQRPSAALSTNPSSVKNDESLRVQRPPCDIQAAPTRHPFGVAVACVSARHAKAVSLVA